jgi:hypothetical protein
MKYEVSLCALIVLAALTRPSFALLGNKAAGAPESNGIAETEEKRISTVNVKVKISAEGKSVLPSGSKIQWEGIGDSCKKITGEKALQSTGATPITLPVCKVKLTVFITSFDTKAVMVDVAGSADKYAEPIRITVKHQGPAEVVW